MFRVVGLSVVFLGFQGFGINKKMDHIMWFRVEDVECLRGKGQVEKKSAAT